MGMEDDIGSLQPWQIFSALYLGFWALSAYFDHFLMTFVFCLAFGVMSEIATRYMNGEHLASPSTSVHAQEMNASLAASIVSQQLPPEPTEPEKDLEDLSPAEDEPPPPLPVKDYLPETEEIIEPETMKSDPEPSTTNSTNTTLTDAPLLASETSITDVLHDTASSEDSMRAAMASSTYVNVDSSQDNLDDFSTMSKDDFEDTLADAPGDNLVEKNEPAVVESQSSESNLGKDEFIVSTSSDLIDTSSGLIDTGSSLVDTSADVVAPTVVEPSAKSSLDELLDTSDQLKTSAPSASGDSFANLIDSSIAAPDVSSTSVPDEVSSSLAPADFNSLAATEVTSSSGAGAAGVLDSLLDTASENKSTLDTTQVLDPFSDKSSKSLLDTLDDSSAADVTSPAATNIPQEPSLLEMQDQLQTDNLSSSANNLIPTATADLTTTTNNTNSTNNDLISTTANEDLLNHHVDDSRLQENFNFGKETEEPAKVETIGDILDLSAGNVSPGDQMGAQMDQMSDQMNKNQLVERDDGKLYAPDSSSDEELEAEYANREVNLDESESEEENGGYQFKRGISPVNDSSPEEGPQQHLSSGDDSSMNDTTPLDPSIPAAKGAAATRSLLEDSSKHSNDEVLDIDLTDPDLEQAATKIQSVFKGFQARKKMGKI